MHTKKSSTRLFQSGFIILSICGNSATFAVSAGTHCATNPPETVQKTKIYFGNGIQVSEKDAKDTQEALKNRLQKSLPPAQFAALEFDIAYNPTGGFLKDIWESNKQRQWDGNLAFWRRVAFRESTSPEMRAYAQQQINTTVDTLIRETPVVKEHIDHYRADLLEGKRVIIVAHSQGNFYANSAYSALFDRSDEDIARAKESFKIISVANPAARVAGGTGTTDDYLTISEDGVIGGIRTFLEQNDPTLPMPQLPNMTNNGITNIDENHHSFRSEYLFPQSMSEAWIKEKITRTLREMPYPQPIITGGVITVILGWGKEPDMDLHVREPDGTHVYYERTKGTSGELDRDDTDGEGPEHYRVSCEKLQAGTYNVSVNYFSGANPETARVSVAAGLLRQTYTQTFSTPLGREGNVAPFPMAIIRVSGNRNTGFAIEVEEVREVIGIPR